LVPVFFLGQNLIEQKKQASINEISPTIPKNYQINKNNEFNFFSL